jgi:N,N'-diacetyllegionaminate synthase
MIDTEFNPMVEIAGRQIGDGQHCFVVAEIGINHNGDMALAKAEIDAAVEAGADAVKFQNYRVEDFICDRSLTFTYKSQGREVTEPQLDMFKRCELTADQVAELKEHCDRRGLIFQSTPMSIRGLEDLLAIGTPLLKNGSDCLAHLDLIRAMGESGLPTVISTGMSTLSEIDEAVRVFRATNNPNLILLHCTSCYPSPVEFTNLARIPSLSRSFGCPVGFSDHTEGHLAAALSVAFGSCLIEKHFTLDHNLPGPDHWFSLTPPELAELVKAIREAEAMVGTRTLSPVKAEEEARREFRLSCVAASDLPAGHRLTGNAIAYHRPGNGFPPGQVAQLVGRVLKHAVKKGHVFVIADFV